MSSRKKILIENTIWVYLAKIVTQLVGLLASVLVLRQLDVDIYGTYVFLFGLFTAYQLLIISPLKHVLIRFIPELRYRVRPSSLGKLILSYMLLALAMVAALTILAILFKDALAVFFNISSFHSHLPAFLFFVLSYALKLLLEVILSAFLLHRKIALLNIVVVLIRAISYLIMLAKLNVDMLLTIEGWVSLIYALPAVFILIKHVRYKCESVEDVSTSEKKRMKRFWGYSLFTELGAGLIGRTSDYYIVAAMSGSYFVGLYGFAVKIYELFYKLLPLKEFESVLKPLVFEKYANQSNVTDLNYFYNFTAKVLLPLFIFPFLYFLFFGKLIIIEVFGDKYLDAYWTTLIILSGLIINGLFYPLVILVQLKEKLHVLLISRIVVGFSIFAGIIMMKHFGIVGVALATLIGELLKNLLMFCLFRPYCRISYDGKLWVTYGVLILSGVILYAAIGHYINDLAWGILASLVFVIAYVVYLLNFNPFNLRELENLTAIIKVNNRLFSVFRLFYGLINKLVFTKRIYD